MDIMQDKPQKSILKRSLPLGIIALVAITGAFFLKDVFSFEALRDNREALLAWRDNNIVIASLVFIGVYICVTAFSLPGALVMTLTGGFLFGIFPGALYNVLGASIGATLIFLAAKTSLGDMLRAKLHSDNKESVLEKMEKEIQSNEISYLFLTRLVPAIPFFVANLAPAFLGVSLRNFVLTTFFGIIPGSLVYTSVGAGLGDVFAAGEVPNLGIIFEPQILGPIIGLCVLAAFPIILSKFKKRTS